MNSIRVKIVATAVVLAALAAPIAANADPNFNPHNVNSRWNHQQRRIDQGIRSGELTPRETSHLEYREASFRRQENFDRRHDDGRLTRGEHRRLEQRENRMSRAIYRDKHNDHRSF